MESNKIKIENEDLIPQAANPIVISPADLSHAVEPAPAATVALSQSPTKPVLPLAVWVVATLVPFMNAWVWWRYAPRDEVVGNLFRIASALLFVASLVGVGVVIWAMLQTIGVTSTPTNWVERVAQNAESGVVLIESHPDSLGSGFVIASHNGEHLILTNRHVVTDSSDCRVRSRNTFPTKAEVVGYPRQGDIDLALLVATTPGLHPMGRIREFEEVRVGQPVAAIGHPLGLDYTITTGIVSAKRGGREIQTSAPISPGNSGGPLVTQQGEVIGVNTRTVDPSEGTSLSFATRADLVFHKTNWVFERNIDELLSKIER